MDEIVTKMMLLTVKKCFHIFNKLSLQVFFYSEWMSFEEKLMGFFLLCLLLKMRHELEKRIKTRFQVRQFVW